MSVLVKDRTPLGLVPAGGWREFLAEADAEAEARLRRATRSSRPAGGGDFVRRAEAAMRSGKVRRQMEELVAYAAANH